MKDACKCVCVRVCVCARMRCAVAVTIIPCNMHIDCTIGIHIYDYCQYCDNSFLLRTHVIMKALDTCSALSIYRVRQIEFPLSSPPSCHAVQLLFLIMITWLNLKSDNHVMHGTLHKKLTSTSIRQLRVWDCYGMGTGVTSAVLLWTISQHDDGLRSARQFRTFVGSLTGTDHAERKKLTFRVSMAR